MVMVKPARRRTSTSSGGSRTRRGCPLAAYHVSGEYVDDQSRCRQRPARRAGAPCWRRSPAIRRAGADIVITYHAKDAARWLPVAPSKIRSRKDGSAVPLDETDKKLLNLHAGRVPARPRARSRERRGRRAARGRGDSPAGPATCSSSASSARSRRSSTPARSATSRCSSPPRSIAEHPRRAAQIVNAHPGVSHNYLRNHEFNMWFTLARRAGLQARSGRHARA